MTSRQRSSDRRRLVLADRRIRVTNAMLVNRRAKQVLIRVRVAPLRPPEAAHDQERQRRQRRRTAERATDDRAHGRRGSPAALRRNRYDSCARRLADAVRGEGCRERSRGTRDGARRQRRRRAGQRERHRKSLIVSASASGCPRTPLVSVTVGTAAGAVVVGESARHVAVEVAVGTVVTTGTTVVRLLTEVDSTLRGQHG